MTALLLLSFMKTLYCLLFRCKERQVVNGMTGKDKYVEGNTIFVETSNTIIPVFAVYNERQEYFAPSCWLCLYSSQSHEANFTTCNISVRYADVISGLRCVVLSRVSSLDNVPLLRLKNSHFINF